VTIVGDRIPDNFDALASTEFGKWCALVFSMIAFIVLASAGAGALAFMLTFLKAMGRELRLGRSLRIDRGRIHPGRIGQRRNNIDPRREKSLTLVMLERYRNDRAA
jgi:hypothetical protein